MICVFSCVAIGIGSSAGAQWKVLLIPIAETGVGGNSEGCETSARATESLWSVRARARLTASDLKKAAGRKPLGCGRMELLAVRQPFELQPRNTFWPADKKGRCLFDLRWEEVWFAFRAHQNTNHKQKYLNGACGDNIVIRALNSHAWLHHLTR